MSKPIAAPADLSKHLLRIFLLFITNESFCIIATPSSALAGQAHFESPKLLASQPAPEISAGAGLLLGVNNPNNYIKLPVVVAIHRPFVQHKATWAVMMELSGTLGVLLEPVLRGVETRHTALQIGPRLRLGQEKNLVRFVADFRGGAGVTDSDAVSGGQGQDFCFNAWIFTGIEIQPPFRRNNMVLWVGGLYTHVSNGGLSEPKRPNDGLDSLGLALGGTWRF